MQESRSHRGGARTPQLLFGLYLWVLSTWTGPTSVFEVSEAGSPYLVLWPGAQPGKAQSRPSKPRLHRNGKETLSLGDAGHHRFCSNSLNCSALRSMRAGAARGLWRTGPGQPREQERRACCSGEGGQRHSGGWRRGLTVTVWGQALGGCLEPWGRDGGQPGRGFSGQGGVSPSSQHVVTSGLCPARWPAWAVTPP